MYCTHFGFQVDPFGSPPPLGLPYAHSNYQKVFCRLHEQVNNNTGALLLLGPSGIGKSIILQGISDELIKYPNNLRFKNLTSIGQISITAPDHAINDLKTQLHEGEFDRDKKIDKTILLLDHADDVNDYFLKTLLNEVKINNTQNHPILFVVIGTFRLETRLQSTGFVEYGSLLNERIRLNGLNAGDVKNYILHRLNNAEYTGTQIFNERAVQRIAELSNGIPRKINTICGSSLLLASLDQHPLIDEETVNSAAVHCLLEKKTPVTENTAFSNANRKSIEISQNRSKQFDPGRAQSLQQIVTMLNQSVQADKKVVPHRSSEAVGQSIINPVNKVLQPCDFKTTNTKQPDPAQQQLVADSPILPIKNSITTSTGDDARAKLKFDIWLPDISGNPNNHALLTSAVGLVAAIAILLISINTWFLPLDPANSNQHQFTNITTKSDSADNLSNIILNSKYIDVHQLDSSLLPIRATTKVGSNLATTGEFPSIFPVSDRISEINKSRLKPLDNLTSSVDTESPNPALIVNAEARNTKKLENGGKTKSRKTIELLSTMRSQLIENQSKKPQHDNTDAVDQHLLKTRVRKPPLTKILQSQSKSENRLATLNAPRDKITNIETLMVDKQEQAAKTRASARYRLSQKGVPYDFNTFIASAEEGNEEIVKLFLDANMPVDAQDQLNKNTALIGAAAHGHLNAVAVILAKKPAIDRQNRHGRTALMNAAANGHYAISKNLLDHGADADIEDANGWNALMHAVDKNQIAIVKKLLAQTTNKNTKDVTGNTALSIAKFRSHDEIITLLQRKL